MYLLLSYDITNTTVTKYYYCSVQLGEKDEQFFIFFTVAYTLFIFLLIMFVIFLFHFIDSFCYYSNILLYFIIKSESLYTY